ncbi:hypothetical protein RISINGSUN_51 [Erwinia phage vB_EamM_RisingSun]|uniref:Uncharacterized protein n=1 Tax=Erwinia phage vB_EamM_RisingSun TaxID=2026080 RepID=A0A223LJD3_9CAUD|nr:hypothetical protein FDI45_gp051 [Erwinia phage vB_EamM_RisingSun]ASU03619.1 hypothetical protein RISINGSUN_51 [Erwinia phage vB_EamM_RisingSun]
MINEIEEVYDDSDETLPIHYVGDMWSEFKEYIPELHYEILTRGLNYILLTYPDSLLPTQITEVFVDEQLETQAKKQVIWSLIVDNIMEILVKMGFTVSPEYVDNKHLPLYIRLVDMVYTLPGYEDTLGLSNILDSRDIDSKERFLMVMEKLNGEGFDIEPFTYIIEDVSEVLLKALSDGLKANDEEVNPPQNIIDRVIANKPLFKGTLTWDHIVNQGQLGGAVESLLNFFKCDLQRYLEEDNGDPLAYGINIICLFLISELNDSQIKDAASKYLDEVIDDITVRMKLDKILSELQLGGGEGS